METTINIIVNSDELDSATEKANRFVELLKEAEQIIDSLSGKEKSEEKMRLILETMQGITYVEWKKLSHVINKMFDADASIVSNKVTLADADKIIEAYNCEF